MVDLCEAVDLLWKQKHETAASHEAAKAAARKRTGLTAGRIGKWEGGGRDHSTYPGFDVAAREIAGEHPELGIGRGCEAGAPDDVDAAKLWEILKEGYRKPPAKHDPALIAEAVRLIKSDAVV